MPVKWIGPQPPAGRKLCGWCSALAKGKVADEHKTAIEEASKPDGPELRLGLPEALGQLPLAVTQTVVMMPLPQNMSMPGMPPAIPVVMEVCWDCANGLTVLATPRSGLTIPGPGVRVIEPGGIRG